MRQVAKQAFLTSILASSLTSGIAQAEIQSRIVNGNPTGQGYEWMSHLFVITSQNGSSYSGKGCGATLIDSEWLLTAAHCVEFSGRIVPASNIRAAVGIYNEDNVELNDRIQAVEVIVHPWRDKARSYYDVALVKLSQKLPNQTVKLATKEDYEALEQEAAQYSSFGNTQMTAIGWGNLDTNKRIQDGLLRSVSMRLINDRTCSQRSNGGNETGKYLCADHPTQTNTTCQGDSGGPLLTSHTGWVQFGVTSFGVSTSTCANKAYGAYANVAEVRGFIEQYVPSVKESSTTPDTSTPGNSSTGNTPNGNTPSGNTPNAGGNAKETPAAGSFSLLLALSLLPAIRRRRMV